ncbi:ABC transporter ATP-binding protein [Mycoplasma miroungirhinis]|uniref:ABC transporter ATP-binding protein n=1 Tax=Mycoplasma miroungirhinis TaxID=754516 RepID=A0A6M4JDU7_9MOLU|nr:ABC transporter ATP-binding protein [Mycoplasma miroungirhinis]QJR44256.1 ABC transporter ATP-binding protein [Mycoplasma miroungirhinis]
MLEPNTIVEIKNLTFKYTTKQKNNDLEISHIKIPENKIISLLGPSGSGKTTLLNIILGFLKPSQGEVIIKNNPETHEIAYIMQENSVYESVNVFNNIFLSAVNSTKWVVETRINYFHNLYNNSPEKVTQKAWNSLENYQKSTIFDSQNHRWKNILNSKWKYLELIFSFIFNTTIKNKLKIIIQSKLKKLFKNELNSIAKKLDIDELLTKNVNDLSGGQKQRVAFAKGIIKKTQLVLMDEPFSALDAKIKESTIQWLLKIKKEFNLSIILVTHDQRDAINISDQIILLNKGKIQQFSTSDQLYYDPNNIFVAKFIGSPEINFIKEDENFSYYIRHNKMQVTLDENGKYSVIFKKHFGDLILYTIKVNETLNWNIILQNADIDINKKINILYDEKDLIKFDKQGQRVYEK